jgi:hypothetical protein
VAQIRGSEKDSMVKTDAIQTSRSIHLLLADLAEPGLIDGDSRVQFIVGFRHSLCLLEASPREETGKKCDWSCRCSSTGRVDFLGDKCVYWTYSKSMSNRPVFQIGKQIFLFRLGECRRVWRVYFSRHNVYCSCV